MKYKIKSIGIYCGSNFGYRDVYSKAARQLGKVLLEKRISLIYGGAKVGLMGMIADELLCEKGEVIGVIPESLVNVEKAHENLTHLHIVKTMHERKKLISELADGFILFPGGAGSLDEFFEVFTWQQLGHIQKPCGILNINNYYKYLINFLDHSVQEGFLKEGHRNMIMIEESPEILLSNFENYTPLFLDKWF